MCEYSNHVDNMLMTLTKPKQIMFSQILFVSGSHVVLKEALCVRSQWGIVLIHVSSNFSSVFVHDNVFVSKQDYLLMGRNDVIISRSHLASVVIKHTSLLYRQTCIWERKLHKRGNVSITYILSLLSKPQHKWNNNEYKYVFWHLTQSCFQEGSYEKDSESIYLDNSISFIYQCTPKIWNLRHQ